MLFKVTFAVVLAVGLWVASPHVARAEGVENLMVPSAAMGRDIPVAFQAGGPHAVFLLDAFNAGDPVSNWVTAGNAMSTLAGRGISVVAPASGAFTPVHQLGGRRQQAVGDVPLPGVARLAGREQGPGAERPRHRRRFPGRIRAP